jgi:predicted transcriptional regulator
MFSEANSMSDQPAAAPELLYLTANIVAAHVRGNRVSADELPGLIQIVHRALRNAPAVTIKPAKADPAVPITRSVFPDYIICLEDGRKMQMLKMHLRAAFGMTPAQYREKWGLPANYPIVAPNYAKRRSALAKQIGLGRKPTAVAAAPRSVKSAPQDRKSRKPGRPQKR